VAVRTQLVIGLSALTFGFVAATQACVLDDVDLTGKSCPCASGWVCWGSVCVRPNEVPDGGHGDGGGGETRDASTSPPACLAEHPGAVFCDGFEDEGLAPWAVQQSMGTAERVTDRVHSGSGAIHAFTVTTNGRGNVISPEFTLTGPDVYFRSFIYVESAQTLTEASFMLLREPELEATGTALQAVGDFASLWVGSQGALGQSVKSTTVTLPRDRWVCIESHIAVADGTAGAAEYFVDGALAVSVTGWDTLPDGGYSRLVAGIQYASVAQDAIEVWVDDAVVSTQPIGCD
jgi:hypothetical protein